MENALLALIGALEFEDGRFWKGYDFDLLNSLHEQGLISQPWGKAKSARLTPRSFGKSQSLGRRNVWRGIGFVARLCGHWLYVSCARRQPENPWAYVRPIKIGMARACGQCAWRMCL